jgi:hypothetical protein
MMAQLGEAMKQPVERRLTAILAADVAGYSRLMGADEEGTYERLKAHRRELKPKSARCLAQSPAASPSAPELRPFFIALSGTAFGSNCRIRAFSATSSCWQWPRASLLTWVPS